MTYVYVLRQTSANLPFGPASTRCSWNIGGPEVGNHPPPFGSFQRVAGPFPNRAAAEQWITTDGRRMSGGVGWAEGGWDC